MTSIPGEGKAVLVTGGTRGIGFATAAALIKLGFRVTITGRGQASCDDAARALGPRAKGRALDLSSLPSIRRFAAALLDEDGALHALVNNAGIMSLDKTRREAEGGVEMTLATNVFGPFLLTQLLLDRLRSSAPARIVNVGSRVHLPRSGMGGEVHWDWDDVMCERSYDPVVVYKNSKLATMWLTYELDRRLAGSGVTVNAVCPGFVPETLSEHKEGVSRFFYRHVMSHFPGARTVAEAAANTVFAVTSATYGSKGGAFIGEEHEVEASEQARDAEQAARFWALAIERTR